MEEAYKFIGRGWAWVDPKKEVEAYGKALELGLTSRRRIVAETLGEDVEDLDDEILEDNERTEGKGLVFGLGEPKPVEKRTRKI